LCWSENCAGGWAEGEEAAAIVTIISSCNVFIINMVEEVGSGDEVRGKIKSRIRTKAFRYTNHLSSHVAHPECNVTVLSNTCEHAIRR
jgi:hypothetical protein